MIYKAYTGIWKPVLQLCVTAEFAVEHDMGLEWSLICAGREAPVK